MYICIYVYIYISAKQRKIQPSNDFQQYKIKGSFLVHAVRGYIRKLICNIWPYTLC